ncbi:C3 and PZP-like, alpha-2-macroglobulin domain containing 8 [Chamberlinius hualienensis]
MNLLVLKIFLFIIQLLWIPVTVTAIGGYILTAPHVFDSGSTEKICIAFNEVRADGEVIITLDNAYQRIQIYNGENRCFELNVPPQLVNTADLSIRGNFKNGYRFNGKTVVKIRKNTHLSFIQTDKTVYNPGQKVKFRVFCIDSNFKPVKHAVKSITIKNPSGILITSWNQPNSINGLFDLEFQLSDNPPLGKWTINVQEELQEITKSFKVSEYVSPPFEVTSVIPSIIPARLNKFIWKICAEYLLGKPVRGQMKLNITHIIKSNNKILETKVILQKNHNLDHCHSESLANLHIFTLAEMDILNFYVEVVEDVTGTKVISVNQMLVEYDSITVRILAKNYCKPGLPYYGYIFAANNDNEPVENEEFQIRTDFSDESLTLKTDENGLAEFIITKFTTSQRNILEIYAVNPNQRYRYLGIDRQTPSDLKRPVQEYISTWQSRSKSYIQIRRPLNLATCDEILHLLIDYSVLNLPRLRVRFEYQVTSRNDLIFQSSHEITLNQPSGNGVSCGTFKLPIKITSAMSPAIDVIIYFVRENGEIVSDSDRLYIDNCFNNQVDMTFETDQDGEKDEIQNIFPGSLTKIKLKADRNSVCAIKVIDERNKLLSNYDVQDQLFDALLSRGDNAKVTRQIKCPEDPHLGRLQINKFKMTSINAFDNSGIVTLTDLKFDPVLCEKLDTGDYRGARPYAGNMYNDYPIEDNKIDQYENQYDYTMETVIDSRDHLTDTWLWELVPIGDRPEVTIERQIPHSITKWNGKAICLSPSTGLGVSEPHSIMSFQPMFLRLTIPHTVKAHESITVYATAFSYYNGCFPLRISLLQKQNIKIVGASFKEACLCAGKSNTQQFNVQFENNGKVNITIQGTAITKRGICLNDEKRVQANDEITQSILVKVYSIK